MDIKIEDESTQPKENFQIKFNKITEENHSRCSSTCDFDFNKDNNSSAKDKFLADSLNILSDDIFSLFGSNTLSDFNIILKSGESLPCHQVMLQARCPNLLSNIMRSDMSNSLDFSQYSSQATRAFFKFIYSGKLDFIYNLPSEDKSDLYVLAKKYKFEFLENFLLKTFSADSFHVYSQSTCSPPESPTREFPDSSQGPKENILNRNSGLFSLTHESFEKDREKFSTSKENRGMVLSFANLSETINNFASTSGFNSSQKVINSQVADESLYDIFKDDIKSPCNSSLLSQSFQSKRKLDYNNVLKETKKLCSENNPIKQESSPEIVMIDSDSNEECLTVSKKSQNTPASRNSFHEVDNKQPLNEELFINSSNSSDLNITGYFNRSLDEVDIKQNEISPFKTVQYSSKSSTPAKTSPQFMKTFPLNKDRSIDKYFEASFPENIEVTENFSQKLALTTPPVNKNVSSKKILTPLQEIVIDEATPKPDYDALVSPELKVILFYS